MRNPVRPVCCQTTLLTTNRSKCQALLRLRLPRLIRDQHQWICPGGMTAWTSTLARRANVNCQSTGRGSNQGHTRATQIAQWLWSYAKIVSADGRKTVRSHVRWCALAITCCHLRGKENVPLCNQLKNRQADMEVVRPLTMERPVPL